MRRILPLGMVLAACLHGSGSSAADPRVGVRDDARMFGAEAVQEADRTLDDLHRKYGWEIVVQTIDSLKGEDIKDRTLEEAKALKVHGLLVLIAKKDHKVWIEPSNSARSTFTRERVQAIARALSSDFKAGAFDRGLRDGLAEIRKDADSSARAPAAKPKDKDQEIEPAPAPVPPVQRNPMAGPPIDRRRMLPMLLVGGLGALALIYLIGRALGRAQANTPPQGGYASSPQGGYAPAPPPPPGPGPRPAPPSGQPGYSPPPGPGYPAGGYGPGYPPGGGYGAPPPRQGGGFVSGALGGLGGAVLGNILYDKFGHPHTPEGQPLPMPPQGADHAGAVPPASTGGPAEPPPPTESYDPNAGAGADWGAPPDPSTAPTADWQPNDAGAGAGGDWGASPEDATSGDWGDQEPAQDDSASAGGDWDADAGGTDADTSSDDQGAGGSW